MADIGDIDGDGVIDLAVGAPLESTAVITNSTNGNTGAVYILFMSFNSSILSVKNFTRITDSFNGGPFLTANSFFGSSIALFGNKTITVGAPGTILGAVYILQLNSDGTCNSTVLIRGRFIGNGIEQGGNDYNSSYNGPPLRYQSQFGSMVANIGDFDGDGITDLAVGASDASSGIGTVYLLFMMSNGTVRNYSTISQNIGGGPDFIPFAFFGSSLVRIGDINHDGVPDLLIGISFQGDDNILRSGGYYVCFMTLQGLINNYILVNRKGGAPFIQNDYCGSSLLRLSDLNHDGIDDVMMGCPQLDGKSIGRVFISLVPSTGHYLSFGYAPHIGDPVEAFLPSGGGFGSALSFYSENLIVSSPAAGSLFFIDYTARVYEIPPPPLPLLAIILSIVSCLICCGVSIGIFIWRFRRKADDIEALVLQSNIDIGKKRERKRHRKGDNDIQKVYVEHYEL